MKKTEIFPKHLCPLSADSGIALDGVGIFLNEIWKTIPEDFYEISSKGNIRRKNKKILKLQVDKDGYLYVVLSCSGKRPTKKIHRLVAEVFLPNPLKKPQVNHKDGVKSNNNVENLEWVTSSENINHAFKLNLKNQKGSKHNGVKLTIEKINLFFKLRKEGITIKEIGKETGTPPKTVERILYRTSWKHLKQNKEGIFYE